jgi:Holliday junction resolvasome RuvABC endonuclease subunit
MSIAKLKKQTDGKTLGIDCSTRSLAFAIFDGYAPLRAGEIFFTGNTVFERLKDAHEKVPALMKAGVLEFDHICFEGAILVGNNSKTGISLAYVYGAVMGGLMSTGVKVRTVAPLAWQGYIGNPNLKKNEKEAIRLANPNKSASWYQNAGRELRKQRTLMFSRQFFEISSNSDNIGDAVAIAWYAVNNPES